MSAVVTRSIVAIFVICTLVLGAAPAAATPAVAGSSGPVVVYSPPVDAPVSDPFRPPATPYGPGNRGIEYATPPNTTVAAAADGVVRFAGVVATRQWVTIEHADGVRTTYGPLATVGVHVSDTVQRGDPIGTSAGALLFTARKGSAYIDPSSLFDGGPPRVHLIPEPLDTPQFAPFRDGGVDVPGGDALRSAIDWEVRHLEATPAFVLSLTPAPALLDATGALVEWHQAQSTCTNASTPPPPPPPGRRFAVLVGGLGSSSTSAGVAEVDATSLGYHRGDVVRFSYAGGRVPADQPVAHELAGIASTGYSARDTVGDLEMAGRRLAQLLTDAVAGAPAGAVVDVIAHSQGGVVARLALADLAATNPDVLRRLGVVVTLATPHQGADLAELAIATDANPLEPISLDALAARVGLPISPDDVAVHQLAPGSHLLATLAATPPPPGVRIVSVAARGDLVVPVPRARLEAATNVVVPVDGVAAHDELPRSAEATREIALAIAGAGPTCETAADAVTDAVSGGLVARFEHALAVTQGA